MSLTKKLRKSIGLLPSAPFDKAVAEAVAMVDAEYDDLPYMKADKAVIMANLIRENRLSQLLELGIFKGKSTAYLAALVKTSGHGHLTTIDRQNIERHEPNVHDVLAKLGLEQHVTVHLEPSSLTWRLMRMLEANPRPQFDFCYFDAGHTWDTTGFAFDLVDRLLVPGGWIIFDDMDWTIEASTTRRGNIDAMRKRYTEDELTTPQVRQVWELLVKPHPAYDRHQEVGLWGIARKKPLGG